MVRIATARAVKALHEFFRLETTGGALLVGATVLALVVANLSPAQRIYEWVLGLHLTITLGGLGVDKPLLLWVNDALMVLFFMLVGLELKREAIEGQLSRPDQIILPALAALGGLLAPAGIYLWFNADLGAQKHGWAIPTATDIAFALAVLGLMASRVPIALKLFLTTIAIIDDIAAIGIIAVFYSSDLSMASLVLAGAGVLVLAALNRFRVMSLAPYMLIGLFIWFCILKSGVHATLAGVVVAAFIPLTADDERSPARHLEHTLHPWVALLVLPVFAFANAGVNLSDTGVSTLVGPVAMGVTLGLVLGKPAGVLAMVGIARLTGLARLPDHTSWGQLFGVAALCGVGFTMSLFIGSLAFEQRHFDDLGQIKLAVLAGSLISAVVGLLALNFTLPRAARQVDAVAK